MKTCNCCGAEKEEKEFAKDRSKRDGLQTMCKECRKVSNRLSREKNIEKRREVVNKYADEHKTEKKLYDKQYQIEHESERKEYKRRYYAEHKTAINKKQNERKATDICFKISCVLRSRARHAFYGESKPAATLELLGCTWEDFKIYIEKQFKPGMNWQNNTPTGWHFDHIKPIASFDLTDIEQAKTAFHYTNCQPLWAEENLRKGASYTPEGTVSEQV